MKTTEEILALVSATIVGMHNRTSMYVGPTRSPGAARTLDALFWQVHMFWAMIQNREQEFRDVVYAGFNRHECGSVGFTEGFRILNPDADEAATCEFVLGCWREIDDQLGIQILKDG